MHEPLLRVEASVRYSRQLVLDRLKLEMREREILALVGQSGSGKSSLALTILGLLRWRGGTADGSIVFEGRQILNLPERELRPIRSRRMALVPQSPLASLNPVLRLGTQLMEDWNAEPRTVERLLSNVDLPSDRDFLRKRPGELSVGMAQRFLIAMALRHSPALLIADEAVSALDVLTQRDILALFKKLNRTLGIAILFISHDLASVAGIAHRVAILNGGGIVECGPTAEVFGKPREDYTQRLLSAVPACLHCARTDLPSMDMKTSLAAIETRLQVPAL